MEPLTDDEVLAQIPAARTRAKQALRDEPRARGARFDRSRRLIFVELSNGFEFGFPPTVSQRLDGANISDLSKVEVSPSGLGLHWETLDEDLSIPALIQNLYPPTRMMSEFARQAGRTSTAAKAKAARENGAKGGRPRKAGVPASNLAAT
jgi:hypothetical protein